MVNKDVYISACLSRLVSRMQRYRGVLTVYLKDKAQYKTYVSELTIRRRLPSWNGAFVRGRMSLYPCCLDDNWLIKTEMPDIVNGEWTATVKKTQETLEQCGLLVTRGN